MSLIVSMLPVYLLANLHCLGMCGPLVMMIGQHRYRNLYFLGRTLSFGLVGAFAGSAGAILQLILQQYQIPALMSLSFGGFFILLGIKTLMGWQLMSYRLAGVTQNLSMLIMYDRPFALFLFGFFTVLLPCGQSLMIFSASALSGDLWIGGLNGVVFALLTSPALWGAMRAQQFLMRFKGYYQVSMAVCAFLVGGLAICRGLAELGVINHLSFGSWHFVIF